MYTDNALMFPRHVIPALRDLGDSDWQKLINDIISLPESHEQTLAFMLMMIRLNGCMACETDSYRAMRGCTACAQQTLRRHRGPFEELVESYEECLEDIRAFAGENPLMDIQMTE